MKRLISVVLALILMVSTVSVSASAITSSQREKNKNTIYNYLTENIGLNTAAASGLMANMYYECKYDPSLGSYYFGLYQWSDARKQELIDFCKERDYNYKSLKAQLKFIKYELTYLEKEKYSYLKKISNTEEGAYKAADYWCRYYERPADIDGESIRRGEYAKHTLFPEMAKKSGIKYLSLSESSITLYLAGTKTTTFSANWYGYKPKYVTAKSSSSVATVKVENNNSTSKKITVTAKKAGKCTITVSLLNSSKKVLVNKKITVNVKAATYGSEQWQIVAYSGVRCRKGPSTSNEYVKTYMKGTMLKVTSIKKVGKDYWGKTADGWFAIKYDGETLAKYKANYLYKITYNANTGSGAPSVTGKRYNRTVAISNTKPKRSGYKFLGWSTSKTAKKATYKSGANYSSNKSVTLYAVWKKA